MMMTKPYYVLRKNGFDELYLNAEHKWGSYKEALRFKTQEAAAEMDTSIGGSNGIFPCSVPRKQKGK